MKRTEENTSILCRSWRGPAPTTTCGMRPSRRCSKLERCTATDLLQHLVGQVQPVELPAGVDAEPADVVGIVEVLVARFQEAEVAAIRLGRDRHVQAEQDPVLIADEEIAGRVGLPAQLVDAGRKVDDHVGMGVEQLARPPPGPPAGWPRAAAGTSSADAGRSSGCAAPEAPTCRNATAETPAGELLQRQVVLVVLVDGLEEARSDRRRGSARARPSSPARSQIGASRSSSTRSIAPGAVAEEEPQLLGHLQPAGAGGHVGLQAARCTAWRNRRPSAAPDRPTGRNRPSSARRTGPG